MIALKSVNIGGFKFTEETVARMDSDAAIAKIEAELRKLNDRFARTVEQADVFLRDVKVKGHEQKAPVIPQEEGVPPGEPADSQPAVISKDRRLISEVDEMLKSGQYDLPTALESVRKLDSFRGALKDDLPARNDVEELKRIAGELDDKALTTWLQRYKALEIQRIKAKEGLQELGTFTRNGAKSIMIHMPATRARNLPPGDLPVVGIFGSQSLQLGTLKVTPARIVTVVQTAPEPIPYEIPPTGHYITFTGKNLDQVRSAFWASNREEIAIVSRGADTLQLRVHVRPPEGTRHIIFADAPPVVDSGASLNPSSILGYAAVTVQEKPKVALTLASKILVVDAAKTPPVAVFNGTFPEGVTVAVTSGSIGRTPEIKVVNAKELSFEVPRVFFPRKIGAEKSAEASFQIPGAKEPVIAKLVLVDSRVVLDGILPATVSEADLAKKEVTIYATFPNEATVKVYVDTVEILSQKIAADDRGKPLVIKSLQALSGKSGALPVVIAVNDQVYEWDGEFKITK